MKLTVLMDNHTLIDQYYLGEPGLAYDLQMDDHHLLFDTGYSDAYLKNAEKMEIDWKTWDTIVISHGHSDHTWGLIPLAQRLTEASMQKKALNKPRILAHPGAFESKWKDDVEVGAILSNDSLNRIFTPELTKKPQQITDRLTYLGEIVRSNDFENVKTFGKVIYNGFEEADRVMDDTALAYRTDAGLVIITGCAHAGICNTIEHAKHVCNEDRILDVIGGFHLMEAPAETLDRTISYLMKQDLRHIYAAHCTDLQAKIALASQLAVKEVGVGMTLEY